MILMVKIRDQIEGGFAERRLAQFFFAAVCSVG